MLATPRRHLGAQPQHAGIGGRGQHLEPSDGVLGHRPPARRDAQCGLHACRTKGVTLGHGRQPRRHDVEALVCHLRRLRDGLGEHQDDLGVGAESRAGAAEYLSDRLGSRRRLGGDEHPPRLTRGRRVTQEGVGFGSGRLEFPRQPQGIGMPQAQVHVVRMPRARRPEHHDAGGGLFDRIGPREGDVSTTRGARQGLETRSGLVAVAQGELRPRPRHLQGNGLGGGVGHDPQHIRGAPESEQGLGGDAPDVRSGACGVGIVHRVRQPGQRGGVVSRRHQVCREHHRCGPHVATFGDQAVERGTRRGVERAIPSQTQASDRQDALAVSKLVLEGIQRDGGLGPAPTRDRGVEAKPGPVLRRRRDLVRASRDHTLPGHLHLVPDQRERHIEPTRRSRVQGSDARRVDRRGSAVTSRGSPDRPAREQCRVALDDGGVRRCLASRDHGTVQRVDRVEPQQQVTGIGQRGTYGVEPAPHVPRSSGGSADRGMYHSRIDIARRPEGRVGQARGHVRLPCRQRHRRPSGLRLGRVALRCEQARRQTPRLA